MTTKTNAVLALLLLLLAACKGTPKMDLPVPADTMGRRSNGNYESPEATIMHTAYSSPLNASQVRRFFEAELRDKRGFTVERQDIFVDNMRYEGNVPDGLAWPIDPTKPGHLVVMIETNNAILFDQFQSTPKAK